MSAAVWWSVGFAVYLLLGGCVAILVGPTRGRGGRRPAASTMSGTVVLWPLVVVALLLGGVFWFAVRALGVRL